MVSVVGAGFSGHCEQSVARHLTSFAVKPKSRFDRLHFRCPKPNAAGFLRFPGLLQGLFPGIYVGTAGSDPKLTAVVELKCSEWDRMALREPRG